MIPTEPRGLENPVIRLESPAVAKTAPAQSIRFASEARLSGTEKNDIATTATAGGRFKKKAHRQEAY